MIAIESERKWQKEAESKNFFEKVEIVRHIHRSQETKLFSLSCLN